MNDEIFIPEDRAVEAEIHANAPLPLVTRLTPGTQEDPIESMQNSLKRITSQNN